jgi:hypothetical protein
MASIMAVLAIISLVAGGLLGTFRHRAYGVWSLAGILIAIVTANVVGTSIGIWMASSIGTTEASPVLVLVKTSVLVIVSLIISYYASDLLPVQHDPKTRSDNIMAGTLGVFNAYLIIATILVYVQGLNNEFSINLFGDGQSFNFNRMFVDGLPWLTSVLVLYIVGWSSIRKFKQAWAKLRGTSSVTPPASAGSATTGANYYPSQTGGFNPSYPTSSSSATPPENQEKKSWLSGISGWFRREEKPSESDMNNSNASMSGQAPMSSNYSTSTYQGTSGATPPYGIATSTAVASSTYNAGYNTTSNTGSGYTGSSAGYVAPSYNTGYTAAPAATSGYSSTTSYTPPASTSGYSSTTSYTPAAPASPSYPSSYSGTSTTPPSNYQSPSTSTPSNYSPYNPGVSSGFNPANPSSPASSTPDATVGGLVAGGLFGATFANPAANGGFGDMNAYQDSEEDDGYFDEDEDEDSQDGYSTDYRG